MWVRRFARQASSQASSQVICQAISHTDVAAPWRPCLQPRCLRARPITAGAKLTADELALPTAVRAIRHRDLEDPLEHRAERKAPRSCAAV